MTFSINLPSVFSITMGLNDLGESYKDLLGLEIIIINDLLKWLGQYPKSIQVFAIFIMLVRQSLCFRTDLRWLHDNLSGPGVDELLQLLIVILNSSFENGAQTVTCLFPISSKTLMSTCQWRAVLNEEWRVFHKLLSNRYSWLLYLIVSIAGNFHLLTQFISSQGPQLLLATSWILISKNNLLVDLTIFLNDFQSLIFLNSLYLLRDQLQSSFHHFLECFVMLTFLAFVFQAWSILDASELTTCSKDSWFDRIKVLRNLKITTTSLMNASSSLLFFGKESLEDWMNSSAMGIVTVKGMWSKVRCHSGWIKWLLGSLNPLYRNIRSMIEFDSPTVSEYLVGIGLVGSNKSKLNESAIIKRSSLIDKWWGKKGSYDWSLILKSLVIISKLLIFTSVSLRYFKAEWEESE